MPKREGGQKEGAMQIGGSIKGGIVSGKKKTQKIGSQKGRDLRFSAFLIGGGGLRMSSWKEDKKEKRLEGEGGRKGTVKKK